MAKFCGNCGNQLEENVKVCGICGTPVVGVEVSTITQKKRKNKIPLLIGAGIVIIGIVGIVSLFTGSKGVNEKQVKKDIVANEEVQNCYTSKFVSDQLYKIKEFELVKEQYNPEYKEDIFYANVVLNNDYFEVITEMRAEYNYYEKGGWIMDEIYVTVEDVTPIKAPDAESVLAYVIETETEESRSEGEVYAMLEEERVKYIKPNELSSVDSTLDTEVNTAHIHMQYKNPVLEINGHFSMSFEKDSMQMQDNEWKLMRDDVWNTNLIFTIDDYTVDYSEALGTHSLVIEPSYFGGYGYGTMEVKSITDDTITYDMQFDNGESGMGYQVTEGKDLTAEFDPFYGRFLIGENYVNAFGDVTPLDVRLTYDIESGKWS